MIMYRDVSERYVLEKDYKFDIWRRDRNDVYKLYGESRSEDTMGIRFFYECYEVKCDPDYDW